jgi:hypothetical protein
VVLCFRDNYGFVTFKYACDAFAMKESKCFCSYHVNLLLPFVISVVFSCCTVFYIIYSEGLVGKVSQCYERLLFSSHLTQT